MSSVAFLWQGVSIHWAGIFAALGALAACWMTMSLHLFKSRSLKALPLFFPAAILFSLIFGRLFHWYSFPLQYESFAAAITDYSTGGFVLTGVFPGTLLAAALVRLGKLTDDFPGLLDILAPAGALGIAVGRLGSFFDASCRGSFLPPQPWLQESPFAASIVNADGTVSWRFATFFWQAAVAAALFFVCLILLAAIRRPGGGHVFTLFLNFYAAAEVVLDSTRYDAHFLRSNGFIHVPQLLCVGVLVGLCVYWSVLALRRRGFRWPLGLAWGLFLGLGGVGGYMEYFVQRHGDRFVLAYSVMAACFLLIAVINTVLFRQSGKTRLPSKS